jgi:hypothetical protein
VLLQVSHVRESTWLVFSNGMRSVKNFLGDIHIPFDCEFLVAQRSAGEGEAETSVTEVYHVQPTLPLRECRVAKWNAGSGITWFITPTSRRRTDLQGITIKAEFRKQVRSVMTATYNSLHVVLYGCETGLVLRGEHRLSPASY